MDTLQSQKSVRRVGQFQLYSVLSIGHTHLPGFQRVLSHPFSNKKYRSTNRQDLVFVRPPDAGKDFRLSINTVWYCRVLLLFAFQTSTDSGIKRHECALVSLLWEYDADPPGSKFIWIRLKTSKSNFSCCRAEWLLDSRSRIVYERKVDKQVFYVLPVENILGKLPVVPVGDTGTIPYSMRQHAEDFVDAAFDTKEGAGDGSRWWYINTWALSWSRERGEKWNNFPEGIPVTRERWNWDQI